jgi:hypothetical protein
MRTKIIGLDGTLETAKKLHLPVKRLLSTIFVWNMDETHPQGRKKLDSSGTPETEILHLPLKRHF